MEEERIQQILNIFNKEFADTINIINDKSLKFKTDLERFYNPVNEGARNNNTEYQLSKLKGESPIGKWIKGVYNGVEVNGYIKKIIGYGVVNVEFIKNKHMFNNKAATIGFHGTHFEIDEEYRTEEYLETLVDLCLATKSFEYLNELVLKYMK